MRSLKVMADYDCWPLWSSAPDEPENLDPAEFVSASLAEALRRWAERYTQTLDREEGRNSGFRTAEEGAQHDQDGRRLAQLVANELQGTAVVHFQGDGPQREAIPPWSG